MMRDARPDDPPRFLADADFNRDMVMGLRHAEPSIDLLSASEVGTPGWSGPDVLAWAAAQDRILLSHDKRTMPDHFYDFLTHLAPGAHSPGVMLLPQELPIGRSIDAAPEIWRLSAHREWRDLLTRLPL